MKTWTDGQLKRSVINAFNRLKPVVCNIVKGKGGNELVEGKRGARQNSIKMEDVILKLQKENDDTNNILHAVESLENEDVDEEIKFEDCTVYIRISEYEGSLYLFVV